MREYDGFAARLGDELDLAPSPGAAALIDGIRGRLPPEPAPDRTVREAAGAEEEA